MMEMTVTKAVAAPADTVWSLITDLDRAPDTIAGISGVERLDGGAGFDVGTRWQETRTMFGMKATEVMEVTTIDPGRSYTVEADGKGAHYTSTWTVEPDGEGSRVIMSFGGEPTGSFSKLMAATVGKLFEGSTRKAIAQDLDDIALAAETT